MNNYNQAIKKEMITTTDINKSIKRCLVKCLAYFGLGLWVYQGEELPPEEEEKETK